VRQQLCQKQIEVFLPTVKRWSRWTNRRKLIEWPLFPGYCFARFDPIERLSVLNCVGVLGIVSFEGRPAAVPDHEVRSIQLLVESEAEYDACVAPAEGTVVEVIRGPLRGVVGRLLSANRDRATVVLSVGLLSQGAKVVVPVQDVCAQALALG
jgi:transcription antitermination factor NusG